MINNSESDSMSYKMIIYKRIENYFFWIVMIIVQTTKKTKVC
jgi:hypothetical protein